MDPEHTALLINDIHTNIHLIRTYLKEFDDILSSLQRPPPPHVQKELLAFSQTLSQPLHNLSLLIGEEAEMGTTSSSQPLDDASTSASTRSFGSFSGAKVERAPSLVHRTLDTIHCTNCKQSLPIHDFDKHNCPEHRDLSRLSSFSSVSSSSTDPASTPSNASISPQSPASDLQSKSASSDTSLLLLPSLAPLSPSSRTSYASEESSDQKSAISMDPAASSPLSVSNDGPADIVQHLSPSVLENSESSISGPQSSIVDQENITQIPTSISDLGPSHQSSSIPDDSRPSKEISSPSMVCIEEHLQENISEEVSESCIVSSSDPQTLSQPIDAIALLSALENVPNRSDDFVEGYDASSLLSALQDVPESSLDNFISTKVEDVPSHSDASLEMKESSIDSQANDESHEFSPPPPPSISEDFDLSDLSSLSTIDSNFSQNFVPMNTPDLMDALATLSSFGNSEPVATEITKVFDDRPKDDLSETLAELAHYSEPPQFVQSEGNDDLSANSNLSDNISSQPISSADADVSPYEDIPSSQGVDKDALLASLLFDTSFPSNLTPEGDTFDIPNKGDLFGGLSVNELESPEKQNLNVDIAEASFSPHLPSEFPSLGESIEVLPHIPSSSLKDDLLSCLSLDSVSPGFGPIGMNANDLEGFNVSGLENLSSFGALDTIPNFGTQEEVVSLPSNEDAAFDLGSFQTNQFQSLSSTSLKDDLLASLSLGPAPTDFGPVDVCFPSNEKLSGLEDLSATLSMAGTGSSSTRVEEEDVSSLSLKQTVPPPEVEFAEFLSNPKKKQKNYAKIGRVGGRKAKGKCDMKQMLEEVAEGQEPPEFLAMFAPSVPESEVLADGELPPWKIAPRLPGDPLIREFHCSDDTNIAGLRRAKKVNFAQEFGKKKKGKPVLMEDTHYVEYPFKGNDRFSLFSVFDGHVGHECAETARDNFHKILFDVMVYFLPFGFRISFFLISHFQETL
jgi:hypothetical protein